MKIKRFVAKTMRQALRQVREEQGPEAVILSNRSLPEGVEVVAAVDYDESLMAKSTTESAPESASPTAPAAPTAGKSSDAVVPSGPAFERALSNVARPPIGGANGVLDLANDPTVMRLKSDIESVRTLLETQLATLALRDAGRANAMHVARLRRLADIGIDADIADGLLARHEEGNNQAGLADTCMNVLTKALPILTHDPCDEGGVFAVVGPTGVGKTTSIAKLAARCALQHGRDSLALISTDTYRIGAQEQLATFARILDVPVHLARDRDELDDVLGRLQDRRLVLIDTAGVGQRDAKLTATLAIASTSRHRIKRLLAVPANVQRDSQDEVIRRFNASPLHALIVTKLDEAASFGATFSNVLRHDVPVAYITDGQRVPEDLHSAGDKATWWVREADRRRDRTGRRSNERAMAHQFSEVIHHAHA
ncbi:MAG: flagellar biosynthesis protein FlhF [Pseudomonadota bacterium]